MNRSRSCILTYHSLDPTGSVISIDPSLFRRHMAALAAAGVPVVPLPEVRRRPGSVALTFDDGFESFFEHAFPVLQEYRYPATVFVVAEYCGRLNQWPSQPAAGIPHLPLMNWSQLREIVRGGISLGAHTLTHPRMTVLAGQQAEREIAGSRACIEDRTGVAVEAFAYPYGDSNPAIRALAARHFGIACGTTLAYLDAGSDVFNLPRLDTYYLQQPFLFKALDKSYGVAYVSARRVLRAVRASVAGAS